MVLLTLLPLVFFGCVLALFDLARQARGQPSDWRHSFLAASLVWGTYLALTTQLLSAVYGLQRTGVALVWAAGIGAALVAMARLRSAPGTRPAPQAPAQPTTLMLALVGAMVGIVVVVGLTAFISPPNNWDSMTYHMGRVMHWIQNRSVAFYPTNIVRQIQQPPWAEYAIAHFVILSGGDRLANLVQWFAMVGSLIGVSVIARGLGADWRGQIFAVAFTISLPMGVLQSTSTQNDYVMTYWLVCFVYFLLPFVRRPVVQPGPEAALALGASLGLALLTKATAYIYAAPFAVLFALVELRRQGARMWQPALAVALMVLALNASHYWQNLSLFGQPLGPSAEGTQSYTNQLHSPQAFVSNVIRNAAIQLGTSDERLNRLTVRVVNKVHRSLLHLDPSDPRTTWSGHTFQLRQEVTHEDIASNPLHLALIVLALLAGIFLLRQHPARMDLAGYAGLLVLAFGLFCFYLKWQPWHVRQHLALFVLWAPLVGVVLAALPYPRLAALVPVMLLACALPWLLANRSRPLVGGDSLLRHTRTNEYFRNNRGAEKEYEEAAAFLQSQRCTDIGLVMRHDDWEYPLWVLLDNLDGSRYRLEHIQISNNASSALAGRPPQDNFQPCAVLAIYPPGEAATEAWDERYNRVWSVDRVAVYAGP